MTQDSNIEKTNKTAAEAAKCDQNVAALLSLPIVLIGMMGSGKSRVGQILAAELSLPYADSDREIEIAAGCSIADFFERYGEEAFRDGELRVMTRLLDGTPKIISTGGGIVVRPETRTLLKEKAICIWLQADPAVLAARCAGTTKRPLLRNGNPETILRDLLIKRQPWYQDAAVATVPSDHEDANDTVAQVLDALHAYLKTKTP